MLEIIHDLAPGAQLAFYSPVSSADMVVGIGALAAGCRIIVDDVTFSSERKFEDGPIALETRAFVNGESTDRSYEGVSYEGGYEGGVYVTSCQQ